eukprot:gene14140-20103_t
MSLSEEAGRQAAPGLGLFPYASHQQQVAINPSGRSRPIPNGLPNGKASSRVVSSHARSASTGRGGMGPGDPPTHHIPFYVQKNRGVKAFSNGLITCGTGQGKQPAGTRGSNIPGPNSAQGQSHGGINHALGTPSWAATNFSSTTSRTVCNRAHASILDALKGMGVGDARRMVTSEPLSPVNRPSPTGVTGVANSRSSSRRTSRSPSLSGAPPSASELDFSLQNASSDQSQHGRQVGGGAASSSLKARERAAAAKAIVSPTLFDSRGLKVVNHQIPAAPTPSDANPAWLMDSGGGAPLPNSLYFNISSQQPASDLTILNRHLTNQASTGNMGGITVKGRGPAKSGAEESNGASSTTTLDDDDDENAGEEEEEEQYHRHSGEGFSQSQWYSPDPGGGHAAVREDSTASQGGGYITLAELAHQAGGRGLEVALDSRPPSQITSRSRPTTASSYWSNYDVDESSLPSGSTATRPFSCTSATKKSSLPLRPSSSILNRREKREKGHARNSAKSKPLLSIPSPKAKPSLGSYHLPSPKLKPAEPNIWTPHTAVLMDPDFLIMAPPGKIVDEVPVDAKGRPYPYVMPPAFPNTYPTIAFIDTAENLQAQGYHPLMDIKMKVRYAGIANSPVKHALKLANFRVATSKAKEWNINWGNIFGPAEFAALTEFQRTNHFPARRFKGGDAFDVVPRFFVLPRDYDEFRTDIERHVNRMYIQKPTNSSRGRGIKMVLKPAEMPRDTKDVLVQHYIHNPYTINGYKFDMRIYVSATCFDPLRLYVYPDGLARFAALQYSQDKSDLKKRKVHLTNYSVNKKDKDAAVFANGLGGELDADHTAVSKWSLAALREHIEAEGRVKWDFIWKQVHDIIAKAVLSAEPRINTELKMKVPFRNNCFEVWGFDILLDEDFRAWLIETSDYGFDILLDEDFWAWLIEVNTCPSLAADSQLDRRVKTSMVADVMHMLAADSQLDRRVKTSMVADVMHMLGVTPYDGERYEKEKEAKRQGRLTGLLPKDPNKGKGPKTVKEAEALDFTG